MRPSKVFEHSWLQVYGRIREVLWAEIVQLIANVFVMEKIASFPFELFWESDRYFWDVTFNGMFDSSVLIVHKICIDNDRDVLTLHKFADEIRLNIPSDDLRDDFDEEMKAVGFKKNFGEIKALFKNERNNRIAHFNRELNTNLRELDLEPRRKLLAKLKPTTFLINNLFRVLCLGHHHAPVYHTYYTSTRFPGHAEEQSDVEKLLDLVARNDPLTNMPEEQPDFWPEFKDNLSKDDMAILNSYRKKFGLPEVG